MQRPRIAVNGTPSHSYSAVTYHMESQSVTFDTSEVNTSRLNPSQTGRYLIYLIWRDGRLSSLRWPVTRTQTVTNLSTKPAVYSQELNSQPVDHKSLFHCTTNRYLLNLTHNDQC